MVNKHSEVNNDSGDVARGVFFGCQGDGPPAIIGCSKAHFEQAMSLIHVEGGGVGDRCGGGGELNSSGGVVRNVDGERTSVGVFDGDGKTLRKLLLEGESNTFFAFKPELPKGEGGDEMLEVIAFPHRNKSAGERCSGGGRIDGSHPGQTDHPGVVPDAVGTQWVDRAFFLGKSSPAFQAIGHGVASAACHAGEGKVIGHGGRHRHTCRSLEW